MVNAEKNGDLLGKVISGNNKKLLVRIRNSHQKVNMHHFKVMELKTYEDNSN